MSQIEMVPTLLILHNREHGDAPRIIQPFRDELPESFEVVSFTDSGEPYDAHAENRTNKLHLREAAQRAGFVVVQDTLVKPMTADAFTAVLASLHSSVTPTKYGVFDGNYSGSFVEFSRVLAPEIVDMEEVS